MAEQFNVKLLSYKNQPFDMFVWGEGGPWTGTRKEAEAMQLDCVTRNPGGDYVILPVPVPPKTWAQHVIEAE